jgi:hypothetical protein
MMLRLGNKPKILQGLTGHNCINLRLRTHGGLYARKFGEERRGFCQASRQAVV